MSYIVQFLLREDGGLPAGVTQAHVAALQAAGVPMVWPTPRPAAVPGYISIEGPPEVIDGHLRQVWLQVEAPNQPATDVVPYSVSARQARLALFHAGLLDDVEAFVAQQSQAVRISWEYATEIRRTDPLFNAAASAFGLSEAQRDSLFIDAQSL